MRKHLGGYIESPLMSTLIAGLVVLVTASAARAQSSNRPWATVGVGIGSYSFDGNPFFGAVLDVLGASPDRDPVSHGRLGYVGLRLPATETVSLGVEASTWSSGSTTHTVFSGLAYVYPYATKGFFLKLGLGWSRLNRPGYESGYTGALVGGLGYDIRVGERVSLTPFLDGGFQPLDSWLAFGGLKPLDTWLHFGLALSFN